jgi:hypothetical protein
MGLPSGIRIEAISTDSLGTKRINSIVALKSQHWPYPVQSQLHWFAQHVTASDLHLLGWKDDGLCGYLRIVLASGVQESGTLQLAIVDTVCVDRRCQRKMLGIVMLAAANHIIRKGGRIGILACAKHLVPFYYKCDWSLFSSPVKTTADFANLLPETSSILIYDPTGRLIRSPLQVLRSISGLDRLNLVNDL